MTTHIRIPDVSPLTQSVADGSRKIFDFPFPVFRATDLEVRVGEALIVDGFTVRGSGSSDGGAIVFAAAPAAGLRVTIRRRQAYARTDDFLDERAPTPHELNDAVDQNVAALQELAEESSRTVKRSPSADLSRAVNLTLPEPEAAKVLGWNGSADALVNIAQVDVSDVLHKSQNLADLPDKAQARINLGLGSAALHAETDFATAAQGAKADSALQSTDIGNSIQAHDADLDWVAANLTTAGRALLDDADAATQRATLGLAAVASSGSYNDLADRPSLGSAALHAESDFATAAQGTKADSALQFSDIGGSIQAHDADLDWVAGNMTDAGKALLDDTDAAAQRVTLGLAPVASSGSYTDLSNKPALGSAAALDVGTGANQVVQLDASGKLPAVDGSAVTNLNAGNLSSGTVAAARLGSGIADGSTFLRGDGSWAALSAISGGSPFSNVQTFTSNGTFTVPAGVTLLVVMGIGGGGGGGRDGSVYGGGGVSTTFGSYATAYGGGGGVPAVNGGNAGGTGSAAYNHTNTIAVGGGYITSLTGNWGNPGTGLYGAGPGGQGGNFLALVPVTPGQQIAVTVGTAGTSYGAPSYAGACVVRY